MKYDMKKLGIAADAHDRWGRPLGMNGCHKKSVQVHPARAAAGASNETFFFESTRKKTRADLPVASASQSATFPSAWGHLFLSKFTSRVPQSMFTHISVNEPNQYGLGEKRKKEGTSGT